MKRILPFTLTAFSLALLVLGGCQKEDSASPSDTCANERTLEEYQDVEAMIVNDGERVCLVLDKHTSASGSYEPQYLLVPVPAISSAGYTAGEHVVFSGRKKSCYGLLTNPSFRTSFGYKLEVSNIKYSKTE